MVAILRASETPPTQPTSSMTIDTARFSSASRNAQRVDIVSLAVVGTRVLWRNWSSVSRLSIRTGSSNHIGAYGSTAWAIRWAGTSPQTLCISRAISMRLPTARRIFSNGTQPCSTSVRSMRWPLVGGPNWSNGQIFIAV